MDLTVLSFENHGLVRVIRLGASQTLPTHAAGHYALLQFGDHPARPYSIANSPNDEYLEFHIKNGGHAGGSTFATTDLKVGDTVTFHGLGGNYTSVPDCPRPLVLIAGGTGLAPLLSIADASFKNNPDRKISLFYGGRHASDLYYDAKLREMMKAHKNFCYIPALSEDLVDDIACGTIGDIALQHPDLLKARVYVAGPVDMVRTTVSNALAKGVAPAVIHSDLAAMNKTSS